MFMGGK